MLISMNTAITSTAAATTGKTVEQLKTDARKNGQYHVASGETLYSIAKKFNMTVDDFKRQNKLSSDTLSTGQIINIAEKNRDKIKSGEGLMAFCRRHNVDFNQFLTLNGINKNYSPREREMFLLPAPKSTPANSSNNSGQTNNGKIIMPESGYIEVNAKTTRKVSPSSDSQPPIPVNDKGNVVAEVIQFAPTQKGDLTGKVIMVNAGHGWGRNDVFAPGTQAKDSNDKIIQEWKKNRNYADNLISSLRARGATVIYTTGDAKQVCDAKAKYKADLLISIHCNAAENKSANGLQIYYPANDTTKSKKLANIVASHFKSKVNSNCALKSDTEGQHGSIGVLRKETKGGTVIPSVMVEMGFMSNATDLKNIDSNSQRQIAMDQVTESIIEYFSPTK